MKTINSFFLFLIASLSSFSQDFVCTIDALDKDQSVEICNYYKYNNQNSFTSNSDAIKSVQDIVSVAGLPMNFIVKECSGVPNAMALSHNGVRYIMYNKKFMNKLNTTNKEIESQTVIAHEVGHHLSNHTNSTNHIKINCDDNYNKDKCLKSLEISRKHELEADRFAGFVMMKLGYSLSEIQSAYKQFGSNNDDTESTHPKQEKRLKAIKEGYNLAKSQTKNESNKTKEKLEEIKGDVIEVPENILNQIERNKLIAKIEKSLTYKSCKSIGEETELPLSCGSSRSLKKDRINTKSYFYLAETFFGGVSGIESTEFTMKFGFEVIDTNLIIYEVDNNNNNNNNNNNKIIYNSPFLENSIDFNDIQKIGKDIYSKKLKEKMK